MSFAIKSTDSKLPPLIFGTFNSDIESMFDSASDEYIDPFPVDGIAELGTNLTPLHNSLTKNLTYPSPDPNRYLSIAKAAAAVGIYYQQTKPFAGGGVNARSSGVTDDGVYLMLSTQTFNQSSRVYLAVKVVDKNGVVKWYVTRSTSDTATIWYDILSAYTEYTPYSDPEQAGGLGTGDRMSDPVDFPGLPIVSALGTGVINMYRATQTSLREFSQYLWTGDFIDNVKKLFQDPMEAVVSVQIVPYTPTYSETLANVHLSWIDTGVAMYPITNQYVRIDCGTLEVSEFWASFLDYPPHTDVSIFLPYIGVKQLSVQDVMSRKLHLIYNIDSLTGSCVAMLKCSGGGLDSVLYSWNGSCNMQIPIGARDFSSIYSSVLSLAASAGLALATKGASKALTAGAAAGAAASAINSLDLDTHTRQAGSTGSVPGYMGNQIPYLIITRPKDSTPSNFDELNGRPSNLGGKVGDYSGFLSLSAVHIDGIVATEKEKGMIESALKSGILI